MIKTPVIREPSLSQYEDTVLEREWEASRGELILRIR